MSLMQSILRLSEVRSVLVVRLSMQWSLATMMALEHVEKFLRAANKTRHYDELFIKARDLQAFENPSIRDYKSVRTWFWNLKPVVQNEGGVYSEEERHNHAPQSPRVVHLRRSRRNHCSMEWLWARSGNSFPFKLAAYRGSRVVWNCH